MITRGIHITAGLFIGLLIMAGCESTIDFQIDSPPRLTIVSNLSPDSLQRVYVHASLSPSDSSQFYTPDNLVVNVTEQESDSTVRLEPASEGGEDFFRIPAHYLKAGFNYSITAFAPGFPPVQAKTYIPNPSSVSDLLIRDVLIRPSEVQENKKNIHYTLQFHINHFGNNRYYHLVFYNQYVANPNFLFIKDPNPSDDHNFIHHYDRGVLIDKEDLDSNLPLSFEFDDFILDNNNLVRVYVELRSITEEYYKYHSTLTRQLQLIKDPFAEPVTIFNNIEGGYGNFSGFTHSITSFDLP